jgi:membrane protease YdiL (CAAX protease family)
MHWPGLPTFIGLLVALGGPALLAGPWGRVLGDPERRSTNVKDQIAMCALLGLVLGIVTVGEHRTPASIGLQRPGWESLAWGAAAALLISSIGAVAFPILTRIGIVDYSKKLPAVEAWPLWLLLFAVLTSGIEEVLYRGYSIERLGEITGSYLWAAVITLIIFGLVHVPFWGRGALLWSIFAGGIFTLLYLWKRNLVACIVAHMLSNLKSMIIDPLFRRRAAVRPRPAAG